MAEVQNNPTVRHETRDVNIRAIFAFGAGLLIAGLLIHFLIWLLFGYFSSREALRTPAYPLAAGQAERLPPEPRLQTNPREDLRNLREAEDAVLRSYEWIDKNAGVVRIPIDEAMKLTVMRGLPARTENGEKR